MRPHVCQVGANVRELLPTVARHLAEQRAFAVNYFVVADWQDELLVVCVEH